MKSVIYSPAAISRLEEIIDYTWDNFGEAQAETYNAQLIARLEALAAGIGPRAPPCEVLMQGKQGASSGLSYYREGSHSLILRESADTLEVVEIFHGRMDIDSHLKELSGRRAAVPPDKDND